GRQVIEVHRGTPVFLGMVDPGRPGPPARARAAEGSIAQRLRRVAGQERAEALDGEIPGAIVAVERVIALADVSVALGDQGAVGEERVDRSAGNADERSIAERLADPQYSVVARFHRVEIMDFSVGVEDLGTEPWLDRGEQADARAADRAADFHRAHHRHARLLEDDV